MQCGAVLKQIREKTYGEEEEGEQMCDLWSCDKKCLLPRLVIYKCTNVAIHLYIVDCIFTLHCTNVIYQGL